MVQIDHHEYLSEEEKRLKEDRHRTKYWKKWGPYVAERQWATGNVFWEVFVILSVLTSTHSQCERITVPMVMHGAVGFTSRRH